LAMGRMNNLAIKDFIKRLTNIWSKLIYNCKWLKSDTKNKGECKLWWFIFGIMVASFVRFFVFKCLWWINKFI
jgi:hypothetical protein